MKTGLLLAAFAAVTLGCGSGAPDTSGPTSGTTQAASTAAGPSAVGATAPVSPPASTTGQALNLPCAPASGTPGEGVQITSISCGDVPTHAPPGTGVPATTYGCSYGAVFISPYDGGVSPSFTVPLSATSGQPNVFTDLGDTVAVINPSAGTALVGDPDMGTFVCPPSASAPTASQTSLSLSCGPTQGTDGSYQITGLSCANAPSGLPAGMPQETFQCSYAFTQNSVPGTNPLIAIPGLPSIFADGAVADIDFANHRAAVSVGSAYATCD